MGNYLNWFDYSIMLLYCAILLGLGLYLKARASKNLESYFLAGRSLPWWMLGVAGMNSFFDLAGTMIITSFLFLLGPRGLFIEFRGGACLALIAVLLWTGKWHRRSGCITGAEWMFYRFGSDIGGHASRIFYAVSNIFFTIGMLAYLIKGSGLFLSTFMPLTPFQTALILVCVASAYTMVSGFYGVVFADLFQSLIVFSGVIFVSIFAFMKVPNLDYVADLAAKVTGNSSWITSSPAFQTEMPKGYEIYQSLFMFTMFYMFRQLLGGMGMGDMPYYFGARSDRECGKLTFLWTFLLMFRWPLMMGMAVLGLIAVNQLFQDQNILIQAADMIKSHIANVTQPQWPDIISGIVNMPEKYPPDLITGLKNLLGDNWDTKLKMVSYNGTVNPETILPSVVFFMIPKGVRGLIVIAMIAASVTTFSSIFNKTIGFFTRDLYQAYLKPKASNKELIYISWAFGVILVVLSFLFAFTVKSINDIWGFAMNGLLGGLIVPLIIRFYWWRFNGVGFAIGTLIGMIVAMLIRGLPMIDAKYPFMSEQLIRILADERWQIALTSAAGLISCIVASYMSKPTDPKVLENFYRTTRPFGFWAPLKKQLADNVRIPMEKEHRNDILALPFTFMWQVTLFLIPMNIMIHNFKAAKILSVIFVISLAGMWYFWGKNLKYLDNTQAK